MPAPNSHVSVNRIIEKHLGTAYDQVRMVADHLPIIIDAAAAMEAYLNYTSMYYGALGVVPTTRPDGSPMEEGDMYYNIFANTLYHLSDVAWTAIGAIAATTEVIVITSAHRSGGHTTVPLSSTYVIDSGAIQVHVEGQYQNSINDIADGDYLETDDSTITFPNRYIPIGDKVTVVSSAVVNTINPNIAVTKGTVITTESQVSRVVLPNDMTYIVAGDNLEVYVNGILQYLGINYIEYTNSVVEFLNPLPGGSKILFKKGNIISNTTVNTNVLTTIATDISQDITDLAIGIEIINRVNGIAAESIIRAGEIAAEAAIRATAIGAEAAARAAAIADATISLASSIDDEAIARAAAIAVEVANRTAAIDAEALARLGGDTATVALIDAIDLVLNDADSGLTASHNKIAIVDGRLEGLGSGAVSIESFAAAFDTLKATIDHGTTGLAATANRITTVQNRIDDLFNDGSNITIETVATDHYTLEAQILHASSGLSAAFDRILITEATLSNVDGAGKTIGVLASDVSTLSALVGEGGETDISALVTRMDTAESTLNDIAGTGVSIQALSAAHTVLQTAVDHGTTGLSALNTKVSTTISRLDDIGASGKSIENIATDTATLISDVSTLDTDLTATNQNVSAVESTLIDIYGDQTNLSIQTLATNYDALAADVTDGTTGLTATNTKASSAIARLDSVNGQGKTIEVLAADVVTLAAAVDNSPAGDVAALATRVTSVEAELDDVYGDASNVTLTGLANDHAALETTINHASTGLTAAHQASIDISTRLNSVDGVSRTVEALSNSFDSLTAEVEDGTTGLSAVNTKSSTALARLDNVDGAGKNIETLSSDFSIMSTAIFDGTTGLVASHTKSATINSRLDDIDGGKSVETVGSEFNALKISIEDVDSGLAAAHTRATIIEANLLDVDGLGMDLIVLATNFNNLQASVDDGTTGLAAAHTQVTSLTTAITNRLDTLGGAGTSTIEAVSTTVESNTLAISTNDQVITAALEAESTVRIAENGDLQAKWGVKTDINGNVAGFGLLSTVNLYDGNVHSAMNFSVDSFSIAAPGAASATFSVEAGSSIVTMDALHLRNLVVNMADIADLDVSAAQISDLTVTDAMITDLDVFKLIGNIAGFFNLHANNITVANNDAIASAADTANWSSIVDDDGSRPEDNADSTNYNDPRIDNNNATAYTLIPPAGVVVSGTKITKESGTANWDDKTYSTQRYTGGAFVSVEASVTNKDLMIGLGTNGTPTSFGTPYFVLFFTGTTCRVNISNTLQNPTVQFVVGDNFTIMYAGTAIRAYKNGILFFTSTTTAGQTLGLVAATYEVGSSIDSIQFGLTSEQDWNTLEGIPVRFSDTPSIGLNITPTFMGYYNGAAFATYINSSGHFYLVGSGNNSLIWNGSTLTINGNIASSSVTDSNGTVATLASHLGTLSDGTARWEIKTNVNDLEGGVGFYNNGSFTRFVVDAQLLAMGENAGLTNQGSSSLAIGNFSGSINQDYNSLAIGFYAGYTDQGNNSVAIGVFSGYINQGNFAVATGLNAGKLNQGAYATAIGYRAADSGQGADSIAIGSEAAFATQGSKSVAIGRQSGYTSQGAHSIAIGHQAGQTNQSFSAVAVGSLAGNSGQSYSTVAIGASAGETSQAPGGVAVGTQAGMTSQATSTVAIGTHAGFEYQEQFSIAIGNDAGKYSLSEGSVAIGFEAMLQNGGDYSVAVGWQANRIADPTKRGTVSIGTLAVAYGEYSSAFGYGAGLGGSTNYTHTVCLGASSTVSGSYQLQLGNASITPYAFGALQQRSDSRDKADITDTTLGLAFITALRPVEYRWDYREDYVTRSIDAVTGDLIEAWEPLDGTKKRTRFHQGLIAQEVKTVMDAQSVDFAGYQDHSISGGGDVKSIGYTELIGPLIKAIQEQQELIEQLTARIVTLEA